MRSGCTRPGRSTVTTGLETTTYAPETSSRRDRRRCHYAGYRWIEAVRDFRRLDVGCAGIFLLMNSDAEIISAALVTGAMGYVHKSKAGAELVLAIRQFIQGQKFISPALLKDFR